MFCRNLKIEGFGYDRLSKTWQFFSQSNSRIRAIQYIFFVFTFNCVWKFFVVATRHIDATIVAASKAPQSMVLSKLR